MKYGENDVQKILFPTDFSDSAMNAAIRFERDNDIKTGELLLLHVIDNETIEAMTDGYSLIYGDVDTAVDEIEASMRDEAMLKLEKTSEIYRKMLKAEKTTLLVRIGIPHEQIVKTAEEKRVSVI